MSNDIKIVIGAEDQTSGGVSGVTRNLDTVDESAKRSSRSFDSLAESTDRTATKASTAYGAFGALDSGLQLAGMSGGALSTALGTAGLAFDALSGVTDMATLALESNTVKQIGHTAATVAHTVAQGVAKAATATWTAAQWLLNVALDANPIGLIVIAIAALIAIIIVIATKTTWFQSIWKALWDFLKGVGHWFANDFVGFFTNAFNKISGAVQAYYNFWMDIWNKVAGVVKGAINTIIRGWNAIDIGIHFRLPDWIPGIGGLGIDIDDLIPDIPYLARGGIVRASSGGTLAMLGEGGRDEAVIPLPRGGSGGLGLGFEFSGNVDSLVAQMFMQLMRDGLITVKAQYITA